MLNKIAKLFLVLFRFLTTTSLLIVVIALNTNSQYFNPGFYEIAGEVLSENTQDNGAWVSRVIDGDTIKLRSGETVRYIGVDAPETRNTKTGIECFGEASSRFNVDLVEGKYVRLEKDVSETDRYGRLLRYVYINLNGEDVMVNKYLLENGYAKVASYPPDIKYSEDFRQAQESAMLEGLGLWSGC